MLLQDTEGNGRLGGGTRLGDDGQRIVLLVKNADELTEIVFAHVVTGIHNQRLLTTQRRKVVLQGLDDRTGTQIGTAYADDDE